MANRYFYVLRDRTEFENVLGCFDSLDEVATYLGITRREIHLQREAFHPVFDLCPADWIGFSDVYCVWRDKILYRYDVKVLETL